MWEPVVDKENITEDRYVGCKIPYHRFANQTKRGINMKEYGYHEEIDRLRSAKTEGKTWLAELEAKEAELKKLTELVFGKGDLTEWMLSIE